MILKHMTTTVNEQVVRSDGGSVEIGAQTELEGDEWRNKLLGAISSR